MNPLKKIALSFLATSIFLNWTTINKSPTLITYATSSSIQAQEELFEPFPELPDAIYPPLPEKDYKLESEVQEKPTEETNTDVSSSSIEIPLPPPIPSKTNIKVLETFGEILLAYEDSILNAPQNKNIVIDTVVDSSKIGNDIFYNMAQRPDLTLTVLGDGYEWFIEGSEILKDKDKLDLMNFYIDFNVKRTSEMEPLILPIVDKPDLVSFISFDYKGVLPGESIVKINLGSELANKNFILYEYNKQFDVISPLIEDLSTDGNGILEIKLSTFDDYIISQEPIIQLPRLIPYLKDDTLPEEESSTQTDAPVQEETKGPSLIDTILNKIKTMNVFVLSGIVGAILLLFFILIIIIIKKNKKKNANKPKNPKLNKSEKVALKTAKKLEVKEKIQAKKQKKQENKAEKIQKQTENKAKKIEKAKESKEEKAKVNKAILSPEEKIRMAAENKIKAIEEKKQKQKKAQEDKTKKQEQAEKNKIKKIEKSIQEEIKKAQEKQKQLENQKAKLLSAKEEKVIEDDLEDLSLLEESPPQE